MGILSFWGNDLQLVRVKFNLGIIMSFSPLLLTPLVVTSLYFFHVELLNLHTYPFSILRGGEKFKFIKFLASKTLSIPLGENEHNTYPHKTPVQSALKQMFNVFLLCCRLSIKN